MAEAAIVLPMIILAVITLVLIMMFLYESSVDQSSMHMYLRSEAGIVTQRMNCSTENWNGNCKVERDGLFRNLIGCDDVFTIHRGLLRRNDIAKISGSWHAADGVAFRRAMGVFR